MGRHAARRAVGTARGWSGRRVLGTIFVTSLVVAGIVAATVAALRHRNPNSPAASAAPSTPSCSGTVSVPVIAAPEIETVTQAIAHEWVASRPSVDGSCVSVTVAAQEPAATQQALLSTRQAIVWIPSSTLWGRLVTVEKPQLAPAVAIGRPVATSPLVLATSPSHSNAITPLAKAGWAVALTAGAPVGFPDPLTTSPGALVALALQAQGGNAPGAAAGLVGAFLRLAANRLPTASAAFADLQAHPDSARPFVTSEIAVIEANRGKPKPIATAVYPGGPSPMLDFPVVRFMPTGTDAKVAAAASLFAAHLLAAGAQQQFQAAGLRNASGAPERTGSPGVADQAVVPMPAPDAARVPAAARLWRAAVRPSNLLAVMDVSGSMGDPAGNGKSKIELAAAAAVTGVTLVPDSWRLGLWSFSSVPPPGSDWTQVVPIGLVSSQRQQLEAGALSLPGRVGGNTALYATALAAFETVSRSYRPDSVNVVTLLTDGQNVDPNGIDLPTLLQRIKSEFNPARPVRIVTIGVGADADQAALKTISDATGGQSYHVMDPAQIRGVLLDAIVANN